MASESHALCARAGGLGFLRAMVGVEVAHDGFLAPLTLVPTDSLISHQQKWVTFL